MERKEMSANSFEKSLHFNGLGAIWCYFYNTGKTEDGNK